MSVAKVIRLHPIDPIAETFGPGGHLAKASKSYEPRPGQVKFARGVETVLRDGGIGLLEGPCGTGKSVGYLAPAIAWLDAQRQEGQRRRIVVATASIALQEQLVTKDLPALQAALPRKFTFAMLKGRSNYVCADRADEERRSVFQPDDMRRLLEWESSTQAGDKAELGFVPEERLWRRLTVDSDDCKGDDCHHIKRCAYMRARAEAGRADVVVVNFHLLAAHLQLLAEGVPLDASPLGRFDVLVCDEGHELADACREFFGADFTAKTFERFRKWEDVDGAEDDGHIGEDIARLGSAWFQQLAAWVSSGSQSSPGSETVAEFDGTQPKAKAVVSLLKRARRIALRVTEYEAVTADERTRRAKARSVARRAEKLASWLEVADGATKTDNEVCTAKLRPDGTAAFSARSVFINADLRARLFDALDQSRRNTFCLHAIILASATLTVNGSFDFIRSELGIEAPTVELAVESPFDFARRCMVVTPGKTPAPDDPEWPARCADVMRTVIREADGRTLGLFSSRKNLAFVTGRIRDEQRTWLVQGERPTRELAEQFRSDERSVLLGLRSLWTGLDVPGDSLRVVVIDRIPFPQRDEPITRRAHRILGNSAFGRWDLPRALMQLRQGFGRLIRTQTDWGVVVILDARMGFKSWAGSAWRSLPTCRRTSDFFEMRAFLSGGPDGR